MLFADIRNELFCQMMRKDVDLWVPSKNGLPDGVVSCFRFIRAGHVQVQRKANIRIGSINYFFFWISKAFSGRWVQISVFGLQL